MGCSNVAGEESIGIWEGGRVGGGGCGRKVVHDEWNAGMLAAISQLARTYKMEGMMDKNTAEIILWMEIVMLQVRLDEK